MSATAAGVNGHQPGMLIRRDPHVGTEASAPPSEATQHAAALTSQRRPTRTRVLPGLRKTGTDTRSRALFAVPGALPVTEDLAISQHPL